MFITFDSVKQIKKTGQQSSEANMKHKTASYHHCGTMWEAADLLVYLHQRCNFCLPVSTNTLQR